MFNLIGGISAVVAGVILGYIAWMAFRKGQYRRSAMIIVLIGLVLRLFMTSDLYLHKWDEAFHAVVAKNMIADPLKPVLYKSPVIDYDYRNWVSNHVWLHKQPFPMWTMAASLALFGDHAFAVRLPSLLLGLLGIWLIYLIGVRLLNQKAGVIAAFLFATNGLILELTSGRSPTDHIDIFFTAFVLIAVYFTVRHQQSAQLSDLIAAGVLTGVAVLCKWLPGLVVWPIWVVLTWGKAPLKKWSGQLLLLILITVLVILPWQLYTWMVFRQEFLWEQVYNWKHITEPLIHPENGILYHWRKIQILYGAFAYIPLGYYIYRVFKLKSSRSELALLSWFMLPYLFFTFVSTKMQGYTLFAAPALFLMVGAFWVKLYDWKPEKQKLFRIVMMILLVGLPLIHTFERLKPLQKRDRNPAWVREIKSLPGRIPEGKVVLFNMEHYVNVMFYTDFIAYEKIPSAEEVMDAMDQGYTVYIKKTPGVPARIMGLPGVRVLQ